MYLAGTTGLNKDGAFQFPVYHRKHPCLSSSIHLASLPAEASPIIGNHEIHEGKYFMAIGLGTPPVSNLVTVDTGSTLSWVVCEPCQIVCHPTAPEAGAAFNSSNSTTYQSVGCSSRDCTEVQRSLVAPFGCIEETDTCLYSLRYGSGSSGQYSAGRLGKDKLTIGSGSSTVVDGFVFGCSEDDNFNGRESGMIGFGDESFSFFNQVAQHANYTAFSYCFPGDHRAEGFLSIGPYPKYNLVYTQLIPKFGDRLVYSLQLIDMMVDGNRHQIDPAEYRERMLIVDSGTADTFLLAPVFDAFSKAMITAMRAKGFVSDIDGTMTCFTPPGGNSVEWGDLPTVEMKFTRTSLKLPPENVFYGPSSSTGEVCLAFKPDAAGVRDVQILGNKATRSFRVVYDLQARLFGFQPRAC
jgi:hypothetical protein